MKCAERHVVSVNTDEDSSVRVLSDAVHCQFSDKRSGSRKKKLREPSRPFGRKTPFYKHVWASISNVYFNLFCSDIDRSFFQ